MFDFAETTKNMTAVEILNYYRNLYYAEPQVTERGIVANAINDILPHMAEVVRCKDCKHWKPGDSFGGDSLDDMQRIGGCPIVRFGRREKDFCCEGERKDNET